MNWIEADPLPVVCVGCKEKECYNCDYAGERWYLSKEDELRVKRKGLVRAMKRLQKQVERIDQQLRSFSRSEDK